MTVHSNQIFDKVTGISGDCGVGINWNANAYNNSVNMDNCAINNPYFKSQTRILSGPPNPKTLIAPVIPEPSLNLDFWKTNNIVEHSRINAKSQKEQYLNGYVISTCCPTPYDSISIPKQPNNVNITTLNKPVKKKFSRLEDAMISHLNSDKVQPPNCENPNPEIAENFDISPNKEEEEIIITPNQSGWVNTNCGYNPEQLYTSNLPTNLATGNCQKDKELATYNKNLFTQTIQPGVYTRSEIIEPINSNIGISFDQQLLPTTNVTNPITGSTEFTEHDPRIIEPVTFVEQKSNEVIPNEYNIYDPRFTGAGTSYRSYTDNLLGQPKFYYDDIDAVKMPNYIVRSNIDNQPFADSYGPIYPGNEFGNHDNSSIRKLANQAFTDSSIQFRTEMQQRLMRKNNANAWQQRQAPINTMGQRMLSGKKCN